MNSSASAIRAGISRRRYPRSQGNYRYGISSVSNGRLGETTVQGYHKICLFVRHVGCLGLARSLIASNRMIRPGRQDRTNEWLRQRA